MIVEKPHTYHGGWWSFRPEYGCFLGTPNILLLDDGHLVQLLETIYYRDRGLRVWTAHKNNLFNGSNIPPHVWTLLKEGPLNGRHRIASFFHDEYCVTRERPYQQVHGMYYEACMAAGADEDASRMKYAAIMGGGPVWNTAGSPPFRTPVAEVIDGGDPAEYLRGAFELGRL